ncbi:hypothetical protein RFI_02749 [Reticulomyxa filosa]|uniref:C2H2-type domain-containing protein n=1 Tax=Reticulomyxa filosa TaxID=46433 RepID=X6P9N6_RETFI|nr:hypothetical protein RFI_02749 [Reticulomyxa filosa]|eukprot:ETO34347.1 hypothetical protein RFI_02749 [Reticulomyxa filosa]
MLLIMGNVKKQNLTSDDNDNNNNNNNDKKKKKKEADENNENIIDNNFKPTTTTITATPIATANTNTTTTAITSFSTYTTGRQSQPAQPFSLPEHENNQAAEVLQQMVQDNNVLTNSLFSNEPSVDSSDNIILWGKKMIKRVRLNQPKYVRHKKFPLFLCLQTHLDIRLDGSTNNNNGFFHCCMTLDCGAVCGQTFHQKSHWARHSIHSSHTKKKKKKIWRDNKIKRHLAKSTIQLMKKKFEGLLLLSISVSCFSFCVFVLMFAEAFAVVFCSSIQNIQKCKSHSKKHIMFSSDYRD